MKLKMHIGIGSMYIEELKEVGEFENGEEQSHPDLYQGAIVVSEAKRALVGAGARALFYPTLLYNILRNKIQSEFRWWDRVDEDVIHGGPNLSCEFVISLHKFRKTYSKFDDPK
ncbi:hypothetical protein CsSME_00024311 [Camellia sinensis var. sinensis]